MVCGEVPATRVRASSTGVADDAESGGAERSRIMVSSQENFGKFCEVSKKKKVQGHPYSYATDNAELYWPPIM